MEGEKVSVAGWVNNVRETASIVFLILRDSTGTVQILGKKGEVGDDVLACMSLPKESVISVTGVIKASAEAKNGFEIIPSKVLNLNPLSARIPFDVTGKVPAEMDVRLDNRHIDLRRKAPSAVFRIESTILNAFGGMLASRGFEQIRTPCIIAEASEGGSEVFPIVYFDKEAYLAQSPQLYKQLAVIGGMEKVFMIMPVFRAEKSNTVSHINEITQMDVEMAFANGEDAITLLTEVIKHIVGEVIRRNKGDIDALGAALEVPKARVVTYEKAIDELKNSGYDIEFGHDFSKEHEKGLEKVFGDAVVVKNFPASIRAFYSMPLEDNPALTDSYDYIYKGLEVCSGAQRICAPELLTKALKAKGLDPARFGFYIDAFRCGAPPHAGWSIGLERLTMQITGMKNIRECALFPRDRKRLTP